jgi:D-glycero-alpha-D-manno-heptose-7-phosphate kinase
MLITSRTPLRVSFFGGGTDYPEYFERRPGAVVGMAIDKYIYVSALRLATFLQYKYRLSYSRVETESRIEDLHHPVVRAVLQHYGIEDALDISIMADLPASSGLGSSSAFTVGLINLISCLRQEPLTKFDLGRTAIHVERELLKEHVGVQDQLHAAFGGINRFDFIDGRTRISPVQMTSNCQAQFVSSLVLLYTGLTRYASDTLKEQIESTKDLKVERELEHLVELTSQAVRVLEGPEPDALVRDFGAMMHEGWMIKRNLSSKVSNAAIDELYDRARSAGALGGKLCGAGGGGFLLMVVPPQMRDRFAAAMAPTIAIPLDIDTLGSTIICE